jgi:hypothetical protein
VGETAVNVIELMPSMKPDRVYLLKATGGETDPGAYSQLHDYFQTTLKNPKEDLFEDVVDFHDCEAFLRCIALIYQREHGADQYLLFYLGDGKLPMLGVIGTMAAFYFHTKLYAQEKIPSFLHVQVENPPVPLVKMLSEIDTWMHTQQTTTMKKKDLLDLMTHLYQDDVYSGWKVDSSSALYNKLNSHFLTPLERWHFVAVEKTRHGNISMTPEGQFALRVFGPYYNIPAK